MIFFVSTILLFKTYILVKKLDLFSLLKRNWSDSFFFFKKGNAYFLGMSDLAVEVLPLLDYQEANAFPY